MNCNFIEYTVAKYGEENVKLAGRLWTTIFKEIEDAILQRKNIVITIIGRPGMGKTTILNAVKSSLKDKFVIYLDLVGAESLAKAAWYILDNTKIKELIKCRTFQILNEHRKDIGYGTISRLGRDFNNWLKHMCEKKKWNEQWGYAERLYCLSYDKDINGFIALVNDLKKLDIVGILLDELSPDEKILYEVHKLVNEVSVPIIITLVPEITTYIKDPALIRRLEEYKRELNLTEEDKKEILKAYCPDYAEELFTDIQVRNAETVNVLLNRARMLLDSAIDECKEELYKRDECIRVKLSKSEEIKDILNASRKLEKAIRKGLLELENELGISYVHEREKEIKEMHVRVDIFFIKDNIAYIGDVKLSNELTLDNIENMKKLINYDRYKDSKKGEEYSVKKFIVTNVKNVELPNFKIIYVDSETVNKINNGDIDKRNELIERILKELE